MPSEWSFPILFFARQYLVSVRVHDVCCNTAYAKPVMRIAKISKSGLVLTLLFL